MPTPKKEKQVEEIKDRLSQCTIAVATGYQGMSAANMTDLRARLREQGIEYRVIKNTLTLRAASELGKEGVGEVLRGPTALAFGYGDVVAVAKGINGYITATRMPLVIHGAVMDGEILTAGQVMNLASLPPMDELLSRLLGQMQAPITGLVYVLSAPLRGLAMVLQHIVEQGESQLVAEVPAVLSEPEEGSPEEAAAEMETTAGVEVEEKPQQTMEARVETTAEVEVEEEPRQTMEADVETTAEVEVKEEPQQT